MDLDIDHEGTQQIVSAIKAVPRPDHVVSSPALRCRQLAQAIARDGVVHWDERLWELDFGTWEGKRWWDIPAHEHAPWSADPWAIAPPGGETFAELHDRVAWALAEIPHGSVIIAHAGVIRAARMIVAGASFADVAAWKVPYAEPVRLERCPA